MEYSSTAWGKLREDDRRWWNWRSNLHVSNTPASALRLNASSRHWLVNMDTKDVLKWEPHITWPYHGSLCRVKNRTWNTTITLLLNTLKKLEYFQNNVFGEKVKSPCIGPQAQRRPTVWRGSAWSCWLDQLRLGCYFKIKCISTTMTSVGLGYKEPEYDKII